MKALLPLALALLAPCVGASQPSPAVLQRIEAAALAHAAGLPGQVKVTVGALPSPLPDCEQAEASLPAGSRPWGDVQVAVRCQAGAAWTRFVPVRIQVQVRHAVARVALPAGHRVTAADVAWVEADLARLPRHVLLDEAGLDAAVALQPVAAGAALRRDQLRSSPVILQGQQVKVITQGEGFALTTEGRAQTQAAAGQKVAVRLSSGQLISAVARPDGTAEKSP